jgi:hypothetical protein
MPLRAFIDESGDRGFSAASSDCFNAAFNQDEWGNREDRCLRELLAGLKRGRENLDLNRYGLKLHPREALEMHPWVQEL